MSPGIRYEGTVTVRTGARSGVGRTDWCRLTSGRVFVTGAAGRVGVRRETCPRGTERVRLESSCDGGRTGWEGRGGLLSSVDPERTFPGTETWGRVGC